MTRYWYGAKSYLFGCRLAVTWEGWAVDAVWFVTNLAISSLLRVDSHHPVLGLGLLFGMMALFMTIRSWKGEP